VRVTEERVLLSVLVQATMDHRESKRERRRARRKPQNLEAHPRVVLQSCLQVSTGAELDAFLLPLGFPCRVSPVSCAPCSGRPFSVRPRANGTALQLDRTPLRTCFCCFPYHIHKVAQEPQSAPGSIFFRVLSL